MNTCAYEHGGECSGLTLASSTHAQAWVIDGNGDSGYQAAPLPTVAGGGWQTALSGAPLLVQLA